MPETSPSNFSSDSSDTEPLPTLDKYLVLIQLRIVAVDTPALTAASSIVIDGVSRSAYKLCCFNFSPKNNNLV